ncbi:hypothetical protein FKP32DRAFT_1600109 [Trametes sanguinea]|nr:hypothetical protein FKP32DRAFT_1600109 [Trametes sanguinea]
MYVLDYPDEEIIHDPAHDIESFYWLLLWVVLRHTHCYRRQNEDGEAIRRRLRYDPDVDDASLDVLCGSRIMWLDKPTELTVVDNKPLTVLIECFNELVAVSRAHRRYPEAVPKVEVTYGAVLAAFDEALLMEGWPENDWKPSTLFHDPRKNVVPSPILHDTVPGYPIEYEGRAMRSKTRAMKAKPTTQAALPTVPVPSGPDSGSPAPAQRSGTKRAQEDDIPEPNGATHSRKRLKTHSMAPPAAPGSEEAAAGLSEAKTSGGTGRVRRSDAKAAPPLNRQPTRRSSRIKAQKERKASRSGLAR